MTIDPRILEIAKRELTPEQHEAWELWDIQGLSYDQIAIKLRISKSSARYRIIRALARLEPHLEAAPE